MKTKLLLVALLFMPIFWGCGKELPLENQLTGEWYLTYERLEDNENKEYNREDTPHRLILYPTGKYEKIFRDSDMDAIVGEWRISGTDIFFTQISDNGFLISEESYILGFYDQDSFSYGTLDSEDGFGCAFEYKRYAL